MSVVLWRIASDTPHYESTDLSGKGAETSGGRWNRPGIPLVYTSTSIALACLETVVHLNATGDLPINRYLVRIEVDDASWASMSVAVPARLVGWDAEPAGKVSLGWGDQWLRGKSSLLASVPSVVVPEERNVLVNPAYPPRAGIKATKLRKWLYDTRLV